MQIRYGLLIGKATYLIQKRATKLVISLKKLSYKDRLMQLNLHTLKYRRLRGDMIEVYKIIRQIYDSSVAPNLQLGNTGVTTVNKKYSLFNGYLIENHIFFVKHFTMNSFFDAFKAHLI